MKDEKELGFEEAIARLESLVGELEGGALPLEDSLKSFEEGVRLVRSCSARLQQAEIRIQQLEQGGEQPLDLKEQE
jgi:exodeoxyribonuclease VII small subunit